MFKKILTLVIKMYVIATFVVLVPYCVIHYAIISEKVIIGMTFGLIIILNYNLFRIILSPRED